MIAADEHGADFATSLLLLYYNTTTLSTLLNEYFFYRYIGVVAADERGADFALSISTVDVDDAGDGACDRFERCGCPNLPRNFY